MENLNGTDDAYTPNGDVSDFLNAGTTAVLIPTNTTFAELTSTTGGTSFSWSPVATSSEPSSLSTTISLNSDVSNRSSFHSFLYDIVSLKEYLTIVPGGNIILVSYAALKELSTVHRNSLVHFVIDRLIECRIRQNKTDGPSRVNVTPIQFQTLAKEIVSIFPTEAEEVYYSPFQTLTIKKGATAEKIHKHASGKLLEYFRYRKRHFIEAGIIEKPTKIIVGDYLGNEPLEEEDVDAQFSPNVCHDWLAEGNIEPEDTVIQYWKTCWPIRRKYLKENRLSVIDYTRQYPCLQLQLGIKLILNDFDLQFPTKTNLFREKWASLLKNNLKNLIIDQIKSPFLKLLIDTTPDQQDAIIISLIPKLMKVPAIKRNTNPSSCKPSAYEAERAFIVIVPIAADIDSTIQKQQEEYTKKKITLQPFLLFVGNSVVGFLEYFVILNNIKYKLDTAFDALDFLFKLFFSLDISYPSFAFHIWQLIQIAGFEIEDPLQKVDTKLKILIKQIQKL